MQSVGTMQLPGSWTSLTKSNNVPVKRRGGFTIASIIGDDFGTDIKSGSSSKNKERQDLIDDDPVPTATTTPSRQTELTLSVGCSRVPPPHFCLPATRRPSTVVSPLLTSRRSGEVGKLAEQDIFAMRSLMGLPVASGYFHSAVQSSIRSTTSYHLPRALWSPLPNQCGLPLPYGLLGGGTGISDGLQLYPWLLTHQGHFGYTFPGPSEFLFHPYRKPKRIRTAFSPSQLLRLEHAFEKNHYVVGQERKDLASRLALSETQVKVWFQNRRTKYKRTKLEEDNTGSPVAEANPHLTVAPCQEPGDTSSSSDETDGESDMT